MHRYRESAGGEVVSRLSKALGLRDASDAAWGEAVFDEMVQGKEKAAEEEPAAKFLRETEGAGTAADTEAAMDAENASLLYSLKKGERPSPEQTAEAKRQYEAVEERYRGTDGWMKSPTASRPRSPSGSGYR
jgi:hypothetical protein